MSLPKHFQFSLGISDILIILAQSAGAAEYTDCLSAEE